MLRPVESTDPNVNIVENTIPQDTDLVTMVKNVMLEGNMNNNTITELKDEVTFLRNELEKKNNIINTMLEIMKSTFHVGKEQHIETSATKFYAAKF